MTNAILSTTRSHFLRFCSPVLSASNRQTCPPHVPSQKEMDPFGALPPDVLLDMLKEVPDLHSLQSLRCASPAVNGLLHEDGLAAEVVEAIISPRLLYMTQAKIRIIALWVWGPHAGNSLLKELHELPIFLKGAVFDPDPTHIRPQLADETLYCTPLTSFPGLGSETVLRVISLSAQVHKFAHACFHTLLDRMVASAPRRPVDPNFDYYRDYEKTVAEAESSRARRRPSLPPPPESEPIPITPEATAPPTWLEGQRLEYGAWTYALCALAHEDAKKTATARDGSTWWAQHLAVKGFPLSYGATGYTESLPLHAIWVKECVPQKQLSLSAALRGLAEPPPDHCRQVPALVDNSEWERKQSDRLDGPPDPLRRPGRRAVISSMHYYRARELWSPILASRRSWDSLGFEVWSGKRLALFGFLTHRYKETQRSSRHTGGGGDEEESGALPPPKLSLHHDLFAWRSVMSDEHVRIMERDAQDMWRHAIALRFSDDFDPVEL